MPDERDLIWEESWREEEPAGTCAYCATGVACARCPLCTFVPCVRPSAHQADSGGKI